MILKYIYAIPFEHLPQHPSFPGSPLVGQRPCLEPAEEQTLLRKENHFSAFTKHKIHKWPPLTTEIAGPPETLRIRFKRFKHLYLKNFSFGFHFSHFFVYSPLGILQQRTTSPAKNPANINWKIAIEHARHTQSSPSSVSRSHNSAEKIPGRKSQEEESSITKTSGG